MKTIETLYAKSSYTLSVYSHVGLKTTTMRNFLIGVFLTTIQLLYAPYVQKEVLLERSKLQINLYKLETKEVSKIENEEKFINISEKLKERFCPEFKQKITTISNKHNIKEEWLYKIIFIESGGNHRAINPKSKAVGLIQITPSTARKLGTSIDYLYSLSSVEQLDFVDKYIELNKKRTIKTFTDTYLLIFSPIHIGKPDSTVIYRKGEKGYEYNKYMDLNKDSLLTVLDIKLFIKSKKFV